MTLLREPHHDGSPTYVSEPTHYQVFPDGVVTLPSTDGPSFAACRI